MKRVYLILLTLFLIINNSSAIAEDSDGSTKAAIEQVNAEIAQLQNQINLGNYAPDVCSQSYLPLVAAEAERNRLARDYPFQLFDVSTGNTYTLQDLAAKANRPITIVTKEQMDAAIAAVETAKQPCNAYSALASRMDLLRNQILPSLINYGDGTNPKGAACAESMNNLNAELERQNYEVNLFTKLWADPTETIGFVDKYSQDLNVSIKESYKILYTKSLFTLNMAIKKIKIFQSDIGPGENIQPLVVCETVRQYKNQYASAQISLTEFLTQTQRSLDQINLNFVNYEKLFSGTSIPSITLLKKVQKKIIYCSKGKSIKKVSGANPKCPTGYKIK